MRARWVAGLLLALSLAGCSKAPAPDPGTDKAAKVVPVVGASPGSNLHQVTLSAEAVTRLALQTGAVARVGKLESIPFSAVVYDPQGQSWTYVIVGERTYLRATVAIDHISGDTAVLKAGPAPGTVIVTAGAPELLGAEYGVGEE